MAVVVLQEVRGFTQQQYDQALAMMEGKLPPGCLVHTAGPMEGGFRIVDVWESQAAFAQETLQQMSAAIGLTSPPEVQVWPVHNFMQA